MAVCAGTLFAQSPPSPLERAASEFKVLTRDMGLRPDSPRKAQSTGAARNAFHGRLFENFRNDFLDAIPHEQIQRGIDRKNLLRRNQFGFNVSGPVILPKLYNGARRTFFSANYEGMREKIGRSYLRTVPILPERDGDYRQVVDSAGNPLRIFDPNSTRPNPAYNPALAVSEDNLQFLRDPFPGGIMPQSRLDPVARKSVALYPMPNSDAGPFFRNNYFVVSPETNVADGMLTKLDHTFKEKHRIGGTYSFTNGRAEAARYIPNEADSATPDRLYSNRRLALDHVFTISPQRVNSFTADLFTDTSRLSTPGSDIPAALGISGIDGDTFPYFDMGAYLDMGRVNPVAKTARTTLVLTNGHTIKRGRHNFRFVGQYVRYRVNTYLPQYPSGFFRFSSTNTSLPGIVNTGHSFASFLLGLSDYSELSLIPSPNYYRSSRAIGTFADTWEPRPGLTISFSLRLESNIPRHEKYDRLATVDLTVPNPYENRAGALVFANRGGQPRRLQPVNTILEPSLSVAWTPRAGRKEVIRASYGRSYDQIPLYSGHWGTQGFNGYATFFSPNVQLEPALILRNGVPATTPLPDLRPDAANFTQADTVDRSGTVPVYQSLGLSFERELRGQLILTASVGTAWGRSIWTSVANTHLNAIHPDYLDYRDKLNDELFRRQLRPYPQYLTLDVYGAWPQGRYRRNAFALRAEKRSAQGISLNATYEFSRQWDDYSGPYGRQDFFNRRNEWSLTAGNNPHRLSLTFMVELPFGAGKPLLSYSDWRRVLVNGWSVSGITSVASGEPLALRAQFNNTGTVLRTVRVDTVEGVDPRAENHGPDQWFNPAAFRHPDDFSLGNGPRTHPFLRGPMNQNHDLSLSKRFTIDRDKTIEFNTSAFNFINNANWNDPDVVIGPDSAPNVNAGRIIGSRGGRVIQVGLRFSF